MNSYRNSKSKITEIFEKKNKKTKKQKTGEINDISTAQNTQYTKYTNPNTVRVTLHIYLITLDHTMLYIFQEYVYCMRRIRLICQVVAGMENKENKVVARLIHNVKTKCKTESKGLM